MNLLDIDINLDFFYDSTEDELQFLQKLNLDNNDEEAKGNDTEVEDYYFTRDLLKQLLLNISENTYLPNFMSNLYFIFSKIFLNDLFEKTVLNN